MNYCTNCGNKVDINAYVCTHCGVKLKNDVKIQSSNTVDKGGFGWGVLGFFIPIVGLILFLVWKNEKPKTAKAAGIGALVYVAVYVVIFIIFFALGIISGATAIDDTSNYIDYYYDFE